MPFNQRFRGTNQENRNLRQEIVDEELSGIFNWALGGWAILQNETRFPEHSEGLKIKNEHRDHCDPEGLFLNEFYEKSKNGEYVSASMLYGKYHTWTTDNGYRRKSSGNFSREVERRFQVYKIKERTVDGHIHVYMGLREKRDFEADY